MKINVQQINEAIDIIVAIRNRLNVHIEELENVVLSLTRLGYNDVVGSIRKHKDHLYHQSNKLHVLSLSLGLIIDYYTKCEQENISYICEETIKYKNRECGMINLQEVNDIMREMKLIGGTNGDNRI